MKLFAQIRKVDEALRLVYGRAAEEVVDKSDEIMDYASSKPHFIKWSEEVAKDTDGKSLGNVRAMHGKVAAGKLTDIDFNDAEKAIDICAKVVDDAEWAKVLEGVYTGFSMGGNYVGPRVAEKMDGREVLRYTAAPNEISLVDRPCIPTAKFFSIAKADGSTAEVEFQAQPAAEPDPSEVTVTGSADEVAQLGKAMNDAGLSIGDVIAKINAAAPVAPTLVFADALNKRYPLDTAEHIRAAWSHFSKAEVIEQCDPEVLKAAVPAIKDAWLAKVDQVGPPADAKDAVYVLGLAKGLYTCGSLANLLASVEYIISSVEYEEEMERDDSPIAGMLSSWLADGGKILGAMVAEEVAEATAGAADAVVPVEVMVLSERTGALNKMLDADLEKAGARNSKADQSRIQAMHDHANALGAACPDASKADPAGDLAKVDDLEHLAKADLTKLIAEAIAPLQKLADEQAAKITKLEKQPAPARVSLRAVAKTEDVTGADQTAAAAPVEKVTDARGDVHEAASLIKQAHKSGGVPLGPSLRK